MAKDPVAKTVLPSKRQALKVGKMIGCTGAHRKGDGWGLCESEKLLTILIKKGSKAYREARDGKKEKSACCDDCVEIKVNAADKKMMFRTRAEAESAAVEMGCSGAHQHGVGKWMPCNTMEEFSAVRSSPNARRIVIDTPTMRRQRRIIQLPKATQRDWQPLINRGVRGIETLPGGGLVAGKSISASDSFKPTKGMVEEAKRSLAWRREFGRGGTGIGIARARDISNGKNLPYKTVKRMKAFFDRHQSDSKAQGYRRGEKGYPSNGRIAWALWGGNAGYAWAKDIVSRVESSKRYYTDDRREEYADRGLAMPDGSYPIRDVGDLKNAIQAFGRAKNKPAVKRHIKKRAKKLGRLDLIPANWRKS